MYYTHVCYTHITHVYVCLCDMYLYRTHIFFCKNIYIYIYIYIYVCV